MTMNIRRLKHIFIAIASTTMLTACYDYSHEMDGAEQVRGDVYVQLRVSVSGGEDVPTRADDPMGGNDGNGREAGINNENNLHNVTLLLFKNLTTATVSQVVTFGAHELVKDDETYETYPHKLTMDFGTYHAVVVANINEDLDFSGKTFPQVANMVATKPWINFSTIDKTDFFTMSSVRDVTVNIQPTSDSPSLGTYENPFVAGDITIERLAARIDMDATGSKSSADFTYDYKNMSGTTIGTVAIKEIKAVNMLNSGTYLLKHFSESGNSSNITFFVTEGTSPTQSKYVWDPNTGSKSTTAQTPTYYSQPMPSDITTDITWSATPAALSADKTVASSGEDNGHKYFILTYAQENTLPPMTEPQAEVMLPKYATALVVHYTITEGSVTTDHYDSYYLKHNNNSDIMRYSVVRNNIYRVTIIPPVKEVQEMQLQIKVKKWDLFTHDVIYM